MSRYIVKTMYLEQPIFWTGGNSLEEHRTHPVMPVDQFIITVQLILTLQFRLAWGN